MMFGWSKKEREYDAAPQYRIVKRSIPNQEWFVIQYKGMVDKPKVTYYSMYGGDVSGFPNIELAQKYLERIMGQPIEEVVSTYQPGEKQ